MAELIALCAGVLPKENWNALPKVDVARDIDKAAEWLSDELKNQDSPSGMYLGLDTLHMGEGDGQNVEFAGSKECDPTSDSLDWLEEDMDHGDNHLIGGLFLLHKEYGNGKWSDDGYSLCDYILFLGYAGIVMMNALKKNTMKYH